MNGNYIDVKNIRSVFNRRFNMESIEFELTFKESTFNEESESILPFEKYHRCFEELLNYIRNELSAQPRDHVGIKFNIPSLTEVVPFGLRFLELREISAEMIADLLLSVQQSNSVFLVTDWLEIVVTVIHNLNIAGRVHISRLQLDDYEQLMKTKCRSILTSKGVDLLDDSKCLPRSLVLAQFWQDCGKERFLFKRFVVNKKLVEKKTDDLIKKTFGNRDFYQNYKCSSILPDVYRYSNMLKDYQIFVYDDEKLLGGPIFQNKRKEKKIFLFLFRKKQHVIALSCVKSFFGKKYQCELCGKLADSPAHRCSEKCSCCFQSPPCEQYNLEEKVKGIQSMNKQCSDCFRFFRNELCYAYHKEKVNIDCKYTICERFSICQICFQFVDRVDMDKNKINKHVCNQKKCLKCRKIVDQNHHCTIQPYKKPMPQKFTIYFYDLETTQNKTICIKNKEYKEHEPILLCAQKVCHQCWKIEDKFYVCSLCQEREIMFEGKSCISEFLSHLLEYRTIRGQICCIAHNAKSFDAQFIMRAILDIKNNDMQIVMQGFKILKISVKNYIHFIDSISYLKFPLKKFPKTFDLDSNLSKGFFPYLFLTFERWNYIGEIPEKKYFGKEYQNKEKDKQTVEFDEWYETVRGNEYNLRTECMIYCSKDVTILRLGCLKFMNEIIELAEINPFFECFTLAQLSLLIYRKKFLPIDKLGIIPPNNYHLNGNQSIACNQWLTYLNYIQPGADRENFFIEREKRLPRLNYIVDGFCSNYPFAPSTSNHSGEVVFEFLGCYHHGCPRCITANTFKLASHQKHVNKFFNQFRKENGEKKPFELFELKSNELEDRSFIMNQDYQRTKSRLRKIKDRGYILITVWECDFRAFLRENPLIEQEIVTHSLANNPRLEPRNALLGRLYYKVDGVKEKIRFYDFCSLYPYAMLTANYFIGAPKQILVQQECKNITVEFFTEINGLAFVTVLPNPKLFFPVLPYRNKTDKKLHFILCRTCLNESNKSNCNHSINERSITGTWSIDELNVAFARGYELIETFEIWIYDTECGLPVGEQTSEVITYDYIIQKRDQLENEAKKVKGKQIKKKQSGEVNTENGRISDPIRLDHVRTKVKGKKPQKKQNYVIYADLEQKTNGKKSQKETVGFFTEYQNTFIQLKGEASGFPKMCVTEEQKKQYIIDFYKCNNVILRMEYVKRNETKRAVAKLFMNSLFGKLCQTEKNVMKTILTKLEDLCFYLNSNIHEVLDIYSPTDNYVLITWKYIDSQTSSNITSLKMTEKNVCITSGIQTTTCGRLKLYKEMEQLGDKCLYTDTDSALWIEREGEYKPTLSPAIGGLADVMEDERESSFLPYIVEACILAPKTYAIAVKYDENKDLRYIVKWKGLNLSTEKTKNINMESMKAFLFRQNFAELDPEDHIPSNFERISVLKQFRVVTKEDEKKFQFHFDKRVVGENFITYPYGYKK